MRSKSALKNILANLILQITAAISGLILPRFFIIAYGSTMNGMIVSVTQFISYMALVEAGVSAASIVGLYKPLADNNIVEVNRILSATKRFYYRSGIFYIALLVILVAAYPLLVKKPDRRRAHQIHDNNTGLQQYRRLFLPGKVQGAADGKPERICHHAGTDPGDRT